MNDTNWPTGSDGDVFRMLQQGHFDFSKQTEIDFNIDFDHWPLSTIEINLVRDLYPECEIIEPDNEDIQEGHNLGYILIQINAHLTYEFVLELQNRISLEFKEIGGVCVSWGLMSN